MATQRIVISKTKMEQLVYNARLNAGQMLRDRGYELPESVSDIPFEEFLDRYTSRNLVDLYAEKPDDPTNRIFVRFYHSHASRKLSPSNLEKECNTISANIASKDRYEGDPKILFVCEEPAQSNVLLVLKDRHKTVDIMTYNQLQYNPTKHFLVPKHETVSSEDEAAILARLNCTRRNMTKEFPKILSSDPIARWYGMRGGTLCKITRSSEQTGIYIHYRVVV